MTTQPISEDPGTYTRKGMSFARGPALLLGIALSVAGLFSLYKQHVFPPFSHLPNGDVPDHKVLFGVFAANGWTGMLTAVAGLLLLVGAAQHLLAKTMSLIVGIALGIAAVIGFISGNVLGMAASNIWTEVVWAGSAAILLLNTLAPRRTTTVVREPVPGQTVSGQTGSEQTVSGQTSDTAEPASGEPSVAAEPVPAQPSVAAEPVPTETTSGVAPADQPVTHPAERDREPTSAHSAGELEDRSARTTPDLDHDSSRSALDPEHDSARTTPDLEHDSARSTPDLEGGPEPDEDDTRRDAASTSPTDSTSPIPTTTHRPEPDES